tara:strand:+ start:65 stop:451 length:387 start_codon:yes stop_codon:yes gene_type:complete
MKQETMMNAQKQLTNGWKVDVMSTLQDNFIALTHQKEIDGRIRKVDLYFSKDIRTGLFRIKTNVMMMTDNGKGILFGSGLGKFNTIESDIKRRSAKQLITLANTKSVEELIENSKHVHTDIIVGQEIF